MPPRDLLIYDADCDFCRRCAAAAEAIAGEALEVIGSDRAGSRVPALGPPDYARAVQLVSRNGGICEGADAIVSALHSNLPTLAWAWCHLPGLKPLLRGMYRMVARHRGATSRAATLLFGNDFRPATNWRTRFFLMGLPIALAALAVPALVLATGLQIRKRLPPANGSS